MSKETIKFLKVRPVKSPARAYEFDAGIDFYVPEFTKEFIKDLKDKNPLVFSNGDGNLFGGGYTQTHSGQVAFKTNHTEVIWDLNDHNDSIKFDDEKGENYFLLPPTSRIMIPSGVKSRMTSPGRALIAGNKSGVATKHGLVFGAQVVDYTYKGEIHLSLINTSSNAVRIYENMKILQFVETPVFNSKVEVTESFYEYMGPSKPGQPVSPSEEEFYKGLQDDRKDGGFGSTDKLKNLK